MKNSTDQQIDNEGEESSGSSPLHKFKYTSVFSGEQWIPARMGEQIYRSEIDSDVVILSPENDSNALQRLVKSYTHRFGMQASVRQCKVMFEDAEGRDVVRRGVIVHIDQHGVAEDYRRRMEIAALNSRRQEQVETLYRMMTEAGVDPASHDFNEPFIDAGGVARYPLDFVAVGEDTLKAMAAQREPEQTSFGDLFPLPVKRGRGRPKKVEGAAPAAPKPPKTPNPFPVNEPPKRGPGRPKKKKS